MKDHKTHAKLRREEQVAALRDGRKNRAVTIPDRKKQASRNACRKWNKNDRAD